MATGKSLGLRLAQMTFSSPPEPRTVSATNQSCPICGSSTKPAGEKQGKRSQRNFKLRHCQGCGFGFVENPWTDFGEIYDDAYYRGQGSDPLVDYAFEFNHPNTTVRQYEWEGWYKIIRANFPQKIKLLDYGCGCGTLVRYLAAKKVDAVYGTDTGAWAEKARWSGLPILTDQELHSHAGSFDLVVAVDVIEHVIDPIAVLREIRRMLKPGGVAIIVTQNAQIAPRDFARWSYVLPEIHVSFFTPCSMAKAMSVVGFEPFAASPGEGWNALLRSRILKSLRIKRTNFLEKILPWKLLTNAAEARVKMAAHPWGRAK